MSDVEAGVEISVSGAEALADAAEQAQRLADSLQHAQEAADELASSAGDTEDLDAALDEAASQAEELAEALAEARDRAGEIGAAASDIDAASAELDDAAGSAEALAEAAGSARDNLAELDAEGAAAGDAAPGLEADAEAAEDYAAAAGHARDNLAEMGAAGAAAGTGSQLDAMTEQADGLDAAVQQATVRLQALYGEDWQSHLPPWMQGAAGEQAAAPPEPEIPFWMRAQKEGLIPSDTEEDAQKMARLSQEIDSAGNAGEEAATALGSGGLGGSLDDMSGSVNDAWSAVSQLEGALWLGEGAMSAVEDGTQDTSAAFLVLANAADDAEQGLGDVEGALGGGAGGGMGLLSTLSGMGDAFESIGKTLPSLPSWLTSGAMWGSITALIGGAVSVLTPLTAGLVSFGVMGAPALYKVYEGWEAVSSAQKAYNTAAATEKSDPTAANLAAQKKALAALQTAWNTVPKDVHGHQGHSGAGEGVRPGQQEVRAAGRHARCHPEGDQGHHRCDPGVHVAGEGVRAGAVEDVR